MIYRIGAKEYRSFHVLSVFQAPVNLVDQVKMIFPFAVAPCLDIYKTPIATGAIRAFKIARQRLTQFLNVS
jgi:hypothetical protein